MKKKQIFSMVLTASMLCNMPYTAQAGQEFSDLPPSSWCYGYVMTMVGHGLLSGYPDNTFRQDGYITRAETATALHKLGLPAVLVSKSYTDVQPYAWYYKAVQDAYRSGVVLGLNHDTTGDYFSPDRYLTRADAAIIASRLYGLQKKTVTIHKLENLRTTMKYNLMPKCIYRTWYEQVSCLDILMIRFGSIRQLQEQNSAGYSTSYLIHHRKNWWTT